VLTGWSQESGDSVLRSLAVGTVLDATLVGVRAASRRRSRDSKDAYQVMVASGVSISSALAATVVRSRVAPTHTPACVLRSFR